MENYVNSSEIPLGFGMALAQNRKAMNRFASLSKNEQDALLGQVHGISSKEEMKQFVNRFAEEI